MDETNRSGNTHDNSTKISKSIELINLFEKFFSSSPGTIYEINEIARLIYSKARFRKIKLMISKIHDLSIYGEFN